MDTAKRGITAPGGETVPAPHDHPFGPRRNNGTAPGSKEGGRLPVSGSRSGATASAASNASTAKKLMLPDGSMLEVPEGLAAKIDKRGGVVYHVVDKEAAVRLVAQLLLRVSRGYKGVVYLNSRKLVAILGLRGRLDVFSVSMLYGFLAMLGFEVVEQPRGKAAIINMRHPLIEKIKAVKSIDEAIQVIRKHLGE